MSSAYDFEAEGQRTNEMPKRTCKIQIEEENMKVVLSREDAHRTRSGLLVLIRWPLDLG